VRSERNGQLATQCDPTQRIRIGLKKESRSAFASRGKYSLISVRNFLSLKINFRLLRPILRRIS
jgi:hypothetical protein